MTENLDGGEYLFAFRMLMVLFRREFSFVDALYLWEVRLLLCMVALFCNSSRGAKPADIYALELFASSMLYYTCSTFPSFFIIIQYNL